MNECQMLCVFGLSPRLSGSFVRNRRLHWGGSVVEVELGRGRPATDEIVGAGDAQVMVFPPHALVTEVSGSLAELGWNGHMCGIIDRAELDVLNSDQAFTRVHDDGVGEFDMPGAVALLSIIEHCDTLVLTGSWDEEELGFVRTLSPARFLTWAEAVTCLLAPAGPVVPGWLEAMNSLPEGMCEAGAVTTLRFTSHLPAHPTRLLDMIESSRWGRWVRVAGFVRMPSRPGLLSMWDQIGETISIDRFETDWWAEPVDGVDAGPVGGIGDAIYGMDLIVIGTIDPRVVAADLEGSLVTEEEFVTGVRMTDVF